MTQLLSRPSVRVALAIVVLAGALAILQPWTVRPIGQSAPPAFDGTTYAEQVWSRLQEEAHRTAVDIAAAGTASEDGGRTVSSGRATFVTVTGTVLEIDRASRVGIARVRAPGPPPRVVAIQVGPVVRGTALRDAASFIHFGDFANQFEFAAVSNALNDHVHSRVLGPLDLDALPGKTVRVLGATRRPAAGATDGPADVVPVAIEILGVGGSQ